MRCRAFNESRGLCETLITPSFLKSSKTHIVHHDGNHEIFALQCPCEEQQLHMSRMSRGKRVYVGDSDWPNGGGVFVPRGGTRTNPPNPDESRRSHLVEGDYVLVEEGHLYHESTNHSNSAFDRLMDMVVSRSDDDDYSLLTHTQLDAEAVRVFRRGWPASTVCSVGQLLADALAEVNGLLIEKSGYELEVEVNGLLIEKSGYELEVDVCGGEEEARVLCAPELAHKCFVEILKNAAAVSDEDDIIQVRIAGHAEVIVKIVTLSQLDLPVEEALQWNKTSAADITTYTYSGDHGVALRGHGIGLPLSRAMMQSQGGDLMLRQHPEGVATYLLFPGFRG